MIPGEYIGLAIMIALSFVVGLALPVLGRVVGPYRPKANAAKLMPYESGQDPVGTARDRFSVKFYLVAMLFILFDIEIVFMYPWAVTFQKLSSVLGMVPLLSMTVFTASLLVGLVYVIRKGGTTWT